MITCNIMGGLGNQLFEIFAMLGYAFKYKDSVIFTYTPMADKRPTYWETFLVGLKPFTTFNPKYNLRNEELNAIPFTGWLQHHYIELPQYPKTTITRMLGYFQSYKYFDEYRDTLFRMIRLEAFRAQMKTDYSMYFINNNIYTISMHFRYGDYKTLQQYHNLLPESYYMNALSHMVSTIDKDKNIRVLYFCEKEDNASVRESIGRFANTYPSIEFVKVDDTIDDWKQMVLMSCCDSHIIANSTYSWWGAYFNPSPNKHVCYPRQWFGPENAKNKLDDMFLPSWVEKS